MEVSHTYTKLIYKLTEAKVKVTKPCVQYLSNILFFIFQPLTSVLPNHYFFILF